ncbi:hypothetical protein [Bremerella cremea]|uniref:hypothetical protein n=1 Tax=Bremerella cremea TaxID=1031537 RepID=UPI0013145B83|nr:hypothetical protein [Bremerella cremea]
MDQAGLAVAFAAQVAIVIQAKAVGIVAIEGPVVVGEVIAVTEAEVAMIGEVEVEKNGAGGEMSAREAVFLATLIQPRCFVAWTATETAS